jgi:hypothetical protein
VWREPLRRVLASLDIGPDFDYESPLDDTDLDFIHRRTESDDIYFVRNKRDRWEQVEATFRVSGRVPELWDPASGRVTRQHVYRETADGTSVPLRLAPHGSIFVVFRTPVDDLGPLALETASGETDGTTPRQSTLEPAVVVERDGRQARLTVTRPGTYRVTDDDGRSGDVHVASLPQPADLTGPWDVQFTDPFGDSHSATFDQLVPWAENARDEIRYFSGSARYRRSFELSDAWLRDETRVQLDLGRLWAVGRVLVNGRPIGVLWKPPYRLDITGAIRPGTNELIVEVANTWSNRLAGDARLAGGERLTRTNVQNTGGRSWRDTPLLDSGLFGPVRVIAAKTVTVRFQP